MPSKPAEQLANTIFRSPHYSLQGGSSKAGTSNISTSIILIDEKEKNEKIEKDEKDDNDILIEKSEEKKNDDEEKEKEDI